MRICAAAILSAVVATTGPGAFAEAQVAPVAPWRVERDTRRFRIVATDNVMERLAIRAGMTILDIGAGTGQFAYEFARRLNGTGKVFATDTQDRCVEYMRQEAEARKLPNLHPVLVRKDGVDDFYGRSRYDLITVFHLRMNFEAKVDYFREMRGFLAEGGRLALILYKTPAPFSPGDFTGEFGKLIGELAREPEGSPYRRILSDATRRLIRDNPAAEPPPEVRNAVIGDFNRTLSDARFTAHFFRGSVFRTEAAFSPEEERYADWLLLSYPDNSALNRDITPQSPLAADMVATVNKLLIVQRFRKFLGGSGMFVSGFTPAVRAAFGKAGYRVAGEYPDLIPFEDMIVLERSPEGAGLPDWRVSREAGHFRSVATDRFMDVLALKAGMTVLDIGTGTGQFALEFAERLRGTGRVFATDIDDGCIRALEEEATRRGLGNLYPVLVGRKGVDPFYGRHRYDLITLIHVPIPDRTAYFARMRCYLADGGRLIVVVYKDAAPFSREDFAGRFPELVRALSREPADSPFSVGLSETTRRRLFRTDGAAAPDEALGDAIVADFNRMLSDTHFGRQFVDGRAIRSDVAFTPAEKSFAEYLLVILIEERVFEKRPPERAAGDRRPVIPDREARVARRFNKLLFLQRFRDQLDRERLFTPGLTPKTREDFEKAGYRLEKEHRDIMPFEDMLVFRPDRPSGAERGPECRD